MERCSWEVNSSLCNSAEVCLNNCTVKPKPREVIFIFFVVGFVYEWYLYMHMQWLEVNTGCPVQSNPLYYLRKGFLINLELTDKAGQANK